MVLESVSFSLTVTDTHGEVSSPAMVEVKRNHPPDAKYTIDPSPPVATNTSVTMDASGSKNVILMNKELSMETRTPGCHTS